MEVCCPVVFGECLPHVHLRKQTKKPHIYNEAVVELLNFMFNTISTVLFLVDFW